MAPVERAQKGAQWYATGHRHDWPALPRTRYHRTSLPTSLAYRTSAAEQILRPCDLIQRHLITHEESAMHAYPNTLSDTQRQVLQPLGIPTSRDSNA